MLEIKQALKEIGLSETESEVYLAVIKRPGAQPASIIANKTKMNRTTVYKILVQLAKMNLVTKTVKHGITCFYAEDPQEKISNLIERRQQRLKKASQDVLEQLPSLMIEGTAEDDELPKIRYYEGINGIKEIYEMILKTGEDYYRYGDLAKIYSTLGDFTDEYIQKRKRLNIVAHAIMPYKKIGTNKKMHEKNKDELRETLYIEEKLFPIDGEVRIFGDKVAILSLRKESLIGILIKSKTISKMFKSIFMLTWKNYDQKVFTL